MQSNVSITMIAAFTAAIPLNYVRRVRDAVMGAARAISGAQPTSGAAYGD
jgi:hypothetical protein